MDREKILNYILNHRFPEFDSKEEWLSERRKLISGTDSAVLHGYNSWTTPVELYYEKIEGRERAQNLSMKRGQYLEPLVAEEYKKATGDTIIPCGKRLFVHPQLPFSGGSPDHLILPEEENAIGVLEIKTACGWGCEKFRYGIPEMYDIQGNKYGAIVKSVIGSFFKTLGVKVYYRIAYLLDDEFNVTPEKEVNDDLARLTFALDEVFWKDFIEPKTVPPEMVLRDVKLKYREVSPDKYVDAGDRIISLMQYRRQLKAEIKEEQEKITPSKKRLDCLDMFIRGLIQDAERVIWHDDILATCKMTKTGSRTLLVKEKALPAEEYPLAQEDLDSIERYVNRNGEDNDEN